MARTSDPPDTLAVVLGGAVAGTVTRQSNATLRFDYDESYQANPEATPVSLSMPRAVRTHQDGRGRRVVTNFLWGLLPENDAVLERWGRHYQVSIFPAKLVDLAAERARRCGALVSANPS